ncbi:MAG: hypothetical protein MUE44_19525 [Oscillatoriaceae cyanobacterium Prado104]|jgi:hypothetical protein|nr:hypothetical protein [Oscillatoriaceae cyanobacterium Prado104]
MQLNVGCAVRTLLLQNTFIDLVGAGSPTVMIPSQQYSKPAHTPQITNINLNFARRKNVIYS